MGPAEHLNQFAYHMPECLAVDIAPDMKVAQHIGSLATLPDNHQLMLVLAKRHNHSEHGKINIEKTVENGAIDMEGKEIRSQASVATGRRVKNVSSIRNFQVMQGIILVLPSRAKTQITLTTCCQP